MRRGVLADDISGEHKGASADMSEACLEGSGSYGAIPYW